MRPAVAFAVACVIGVPAPARPCELATARTARWQLRVERGVSWLVTPCGEPFFSVGINALDGGAPTRTDRGRVAYHWATFAPDMGAWLDVTRGRVARWGFNTAGATSLPPATLRLPVIPDLELGRSARFHWVDPFHPDAAARLDAEARRLVVPFRDSPYRIGYFTDNEVGWWGGALFGFYARQPASNRTKQRLVALLRDHYGDDWRRFTADWRPPPGAASFDDLLASATPPHLRVGGAGSAVIRRWTGVVAERYYALTSAAIRAADPDALVFGDRLPIYYDPAAVRAMAPYVDAIATNYNVDAADGWIAPYYFDGLRALSGGKPVLVSEWFFAADENRTGNRNNGHLMTVRTQVERAGGAAAAARRLAARPEVVGLHWFQYYDHPRGGRVVDGEDYNFGLVDVDDRPYDELVDALGAANAQLAALHAAGVPAPPVAASMPRADIRADDRSLVDWPKDRARVRGLAASPGEVPFADVHVAWSRSGLSLALIAMDYYAPDLLAYGDVFPREEAFRLDWGVDAGAGARRFRLSVIPPKVFPENGGVPMMQVELCGGGTPSCTAVPGATATYFGSDQPRITTEVTVPWSALGVERLAPATVRMEVAVTAWHRSRWMSWGGREPATALADAGTWHTVALETGAGT